MPQLDPAMQAILDSFAEREVPPLEELPVAEARGLAEELNRVWNEDPLPLADVRDIELPGGAGPVRVRLYRPERQAAPAPCLVYVHGGGWVICSLDTHDDLCRRLARAGGFAVASVDYRLAPEHPFPAPLEDTLAAIRGLRADAAGLGLDPDRMALAGDSAGANLGLAAALVMRHDGEAAMRALALIYGVFSADNDSPSHVAFGDGSYVLSTPLMRWFWNHYVPDPANRADPLVTPLNADLRGLPPIYLAAAELDPLRDDSERLARRLVDAGADFDFRLWRGVTHASFLYAKRLPAAERFIAEVARFVAVRVAG